MTDEHPTHHDISVETATRADMAAVYDEIADRFSATRRYVWPEVDEFCTSHTGDIALDIGCGNGRHTALLVEQSQTALGVDLSLELLSIAVSRVPGATFCTGDALNLPVRSNIVDLGLYVATIHHLPSRAERIASLNELNRVLSNTGIALISTWSTAHDRFEEPSDGTGFAAIIDWTYPEGGSVPRYYYIYHPDEFVADIEASALSIESHNVSSGNCYITVRKGT